MRKPKTRKKRFKVSGLKFLMLLFMFLSHTFTFAMPAREDSDSDIGSVSEIESSIRDDRSDIGASPSECQRAERAGASDEIKQIKNQLCDLKMDFIKLLVLSEQFKENDSKFEKGIEDIVQKLRPQLAFNRISLGSIEISILTEEEFQRKYGNCWVLMDGREILGSDLQKSRPTWTHLPDTRGIFLRDENYESTDVNTQELENPSGDTELIIDSNEKHTTYCSMKVYNSIKVSYSPSND